LSQILNTQAFRYTFFTFCLSVCVYQVYRICDIYLLYKITTSVTYGNISVISLPAITICFDKIDVLRDEYFVEFNISHNQWDRNESKLQVEKLCANYTIKQQFETLFYKYSQIFSHCLVLKTIAFNNEKTFHKYNDSYINCENISQIKTSIDYTR